MMDEKIEFDCEVEEREFQISSWGTGKESVIPLSAQGLNIKPGEKYHVTLDRAEPRLWPCPFCGRQPTISQSESGAWYVGCTRCAVSMGGFYTEDLVVDGWNRRAGGE